MRELQRLTAYAVVRVADQVPHRVGVPSRRPGGCGRPQPPDADRLVLVRASGLSDLAGRWFLPGGGVDHGEHPEAAVAREVAEETGLEVRVVGLDTVLDDVLELPYRGVRVHTVRLIYRAEATGGRLRPEPDGTTDAVRVLTLAEAAALPVVPHVARVLDLPPAEPERPAPPRSPEPLSGLVRSGRTADPSAAGAPRVRQRLAAYGLSHRGQGADTELLLALFNPRDGRPPRWTLPGGGVDHGEPVADALVREVHEETGLTVHGCRLRGVVSRHFTGSAPDGVVEDYHGVGVVFDTEVDDGEPRVVEVDGTTSDARWVRLTELPRLSTTSLIDAARRLDPPPTVGS